MAGVAASPSPGQPARRRFCVHCTAPLFRSSRTTSPFDTVTNTAWNPKRRSVGTGEPTIGAASVRVHATFPVVLSRAVTVEPVAMNVR